MKQWLKTRRIGVSNILGKKSPLPQQLRPKRKNPKTKSSGCLKTPASVVNRFTVPAFREMRSVLKSRLRLPLDLRQVVLFRMPRPPYPNPARMARAEGTVDVKLIIGEEGNVIAAAAISGHPLLHAVSVAAAREAVFTPTRRAGKPVKVVGVIQYYFVTR